MKKILFLLLLLVLAFTSIAFADNIQGCQVFQMLFSDSGKEYSLGEPAISTSYTTDTTSVYIMVDIKEGNVALVAPEYTVLWENISADKGLMAGIAVAASWNKFEALFDSPLSLVLKLSENESESLLITDKAGADLLIKALNESVDSGS